MTTQYPTWSLPQEAAQLAAAQQLAADRSARLPSPMEAEPRIPTLIEPTPTLGYEYLRHLLIGSPNAARHTVERLHLMGYVERHLWTPDIAIGPQGIRITPAHGQVLRYLVQQRPIR
ncbi:MAG: hypothetical protein AAF289_11575 [Cyanobacteria bacterium P01_A01_bin.135]